MNLFALNPYLPWIFCSLESPWFFTLCLPPRLQLALIPFILLSSAYLISTSAPSDNVVYTFFFFFWLSPFLINLS